MLHLRLLLFAFQTALTTAICIVEYNSWTDLSAAEKSRLGGLYIPYFIFRELKSFIFSPPQIVLFMSEWKGKVEGTALEGYFADTSSLAVVMFVDMYGRVKARLTTVGESSQKSKLK